MTIFKLDSNLTFGKYKGKTIQDVINDDPDYIAWAADTIEWFDLDEEAIEAVDIALFSQEDDVRDYSFEEPF